MRQVASCTQAGHMGQSQVPPKKFMAFCFSHNLNPLQCNIDPILAFTQYLVHQGFTTRNINNYLSSLKTCFIWMKCNGPLLETREWTWNLQSIPKIVRDPPILRASIVWEHLRLLSLLCYDKPQLAPIRVFITFAYYGLFRISNLVPQSKGQFRPGTPSSEMSSLQKEACKASLNGPNPGMHQHLLP